MWPPPGQSESVIQFVSREVPFSMTLSRFLLLWRTPEKLKSRPRVHSRPRFDVNAIMKLSIVVSKIHGGRKLYLLCFFYCVSFVSFLFFLDIGSVARNIGLVASGLFNFQAVFAKYRRHNTLSLSFILSLSLFVYF